jgi:hypothetical protein
LFPGSLGCLQAVFCPFALADGPSAGVDAEERGYDRVGFGAQLRELGGPAGFVACHASPSVPAGVPVVRVPFLIRSGL